MLRRASRSTFTNRKISMAIPNKNLREKATGGPALTGNRRPATSLKARNGLAQPKKARVYEHIALQVEHAIFQRRLRHGDKLLSERELAAEFGVSRVVVREALRTLQLKGLLEVKKGATGGYFVRHADAEVLKEGLRTLVILGEFTVAHLAEVRVSIEPEVARLAALRSTPKDKQALAALLEQRALASAAGEDVGMLDLEFHRLVAAASHNPLYVALLDSLMTLEADLVVPMKLFDSEDHQMVDDDHRDIFSAIIDGDAARAWDTMRHHVLDLHDRKIARE
jgi:GntR family transcriptional repressor for pyruvate dehydrogenase complex